MLNRIYGSIIRPVARKLLPPLPRSIRQGHAAGLRFAARDVSDSFYLGTYETRIQDVLAGHVKAGGVVYDIGANVGFFTLLAARLVGPAGAVHAFEPVAGNVETIRRNVRLNRFHNVQVHPVAVADKAGRQELLLSRYAGGGSLTAAGATVPDVAGRCLVPTVTVDELIARGETPPPTVVKIDVEGAESSVLNGMSRTLRNHRPVLLYEVDDADAAVMRERWAQLDQLVTAAGYRPERLENVYTGGGWFVGHTLALPPDGPLDADL